jgi:hypothetical protein
MHPRAATLHYRTLPSSQGGLWRRHMSSGSGSCLPAREGSGNATCPAVLDLASPTGGLRRFHVSRGSRPCLPGREGSGVATCPAAPDPASPLGRAPVPPRVPRHSTSCGSQE